MKNALQKFSDKDLFGKYYSLKGMQKQDQDRLNKDQFLFKEEDQHLQASNYSLKGRGIFHNEEKSFLIWLNEEDHLQIISIQKGGDVGQTLDRLIRGIKV